MSRRRIWVFAFTATCLLTLGAQASAQVQPERTDRPDRSRLEERVRSRIGEIIRQRLDLTEAQAERLSAIAREFEGRRRQLSREERQARAEAEALVSSESADDAAAGVLLERFVTLRIREADLAREEQVRLQDVLTASQVLELYELRAEIGRRIRAIRGREGGRRGPPGPGG
jgi:Spy/CpxP family protein refolding chaperone